MTCLARLVVAALALLLLAVGAAPATGATPPPGAYDVDAYAEMLRSDGTSTRVRVVLGRKGCAADSWLGYRDVVSSTGAPPTGTLTVARDGRTLGTFELAPPPGPGTSEVEVDVPGGTWGTSLTLTYAGDRYYKPRTFDVTLVEPARAVTVTADAVMPNGDGTFFVMGLLHVAGDAPVTPLRTTTLTLTPTRSFLSTAPVATVQATVDLSPWHSTREGHTVAYRWQVRRAQLGFAQDAGIHVTVDLNRPYYFPRSLYPDEEARGVYAYADTVQVTAAPGPDGTIEVSHLRGPEPCDYYTFIEVRLAGEQFFKPVRWAPRPDGNYCRGTVPRPQGTGKAEVEIKLLWPDPLSSTPASVTVDLSPAPRTMRLEHEHTRTHQTVTVHTDPAAARTTLQVRGTSGSWETSRASTAATPQFTIERRSAPRTYRVVVAEDDAGVGVVSQEFTVVPDPTRKAEKKLVGSYSSQTTCLKKVKVIVDSSDGHWNGSYCTRFFSGWPTGQADYLGYVTYEP